MMLRAAFVLVTLAMSTQHKPLVFVTRQGLKSEDLSKLAKESSVSKDKSATGFLHLEGESYQFLLSKSLWPADAIRCHRQLLSVMTRAIVKGETSISLKDLTAEERHSVKAALLSMAGSLDAGTRHIFESDSLKFGFQASVTATFKGQGKTGILNANSPKINGHDVITGDREPTDAELAAGFKRLQTSLSELNIGPLSQFVVQPASSLRISSLAKVTTDLEALLRPIQDLIDEYESDLSELKKAVRDAGFGNDIPKESNFANLPEKFKDEIVRDARLMYRDLGFSSPTEAENWVRPSQMTTSRGYLSLAMGGWDPNQKAHTVGFFPLDPP
ncbi:MAG TPA: hypothetical protein PKA27_05510 [Fimbriimonadaceae bacterium]|nr:hypothetical protein [Fimbriimonadaceae bacterium]